MTTIDRAELWTQLLRQLASEIPSLTVWKPYEPALRALEDVDVAAPRRMWPEIEEIFRDLIRGLRLPLVACRHIPWVLNLFAVLDGTLVQLEVRASHSFRGALQWRADDLIQASQVDERGVRILRPGAAGLLQLTLRGLRAGGRQNPAELSSQHIGDLLRSDPVGVEIMARQLRMPTGLLRRASEAVTADEWDRRAALGLEASALARAMLTPHIAVRRSWFRHYRRTRCPVLRTVYHDGRRLTQPAEEWLRVAKGSRHQVDIMVPTAGRFIVLIGPDGVGKSTTAAELLSRHPGDRGYVDFRPRLRSALPQAPPTAPKPRGVKHRPRGSRLAGWLRLAKNIAWFWAGYLITVRPLLRRGGLVVADRWAYGYLVQPGPLRFYGPDAVARVGVRLMPHPDLVANLAASPDTVVERKAELTKEEVADELARWPQLPVPRLVTIDATPHPDIVADRILAALERDRSRAWS